MARPSFVEQDSWATKQDSIEVEFLGGTSQQCLDETLRHKQTKPTVGVLRTEPVVEWQPKFTRASTAPRKELATVASLSRVGPSQLTCEGNDGTC